MSIDKNIAMHSAEHLLNGTMVKLFGCERSFSAHINKKKSKCDYHFGRDLNPKEIQAIESAVNEVIKSNLKVNEAFVSRAEAGEIFNLSRLPEEVQERVRIIKMGDYDAVPCIGKHVERTSQIGRFQITTTSFEAGILRIRFKLT